MTLASAIDDLTSSGFTEHFAMADGELRALDSGKTFSAAELVIRESHCFEGVSDPDDMSIVYAIESQTGVRGTLVDVFGVYADPAVSAFISGRPDSRGCAVRHGCECVRTTAGVLAPGPGGQGSAPEGSSVKCPRNASTRRDPAAGGSHDGSGSDRGVQGSGRVDAG